MASSVDYSKYYYKWGTIRFRWLEFGEENGNRRQIDNYLGSFFSNRRRSPFLEAVSFDGSTQLLLRYDDYNRAKIALEEKIDMELPKIGNTRLSAANPRVDPVTIRNVQELKSVLRRINERNRSLRLQQQREAKVHAENVKEYLRDNPDATFLVVDVEMYEHDHSQITEIGFVVFQRNRYNEAEHFHYIIEENRKYVNKDHVPDNRDGFLFGKSIVTSLEKAETVLKEQLKCVSAVVGHAVKEDKKILEGVSLDGKFLVDTQQLAFATASNPIPMSLKHVLETHCVAFDMNDLHNAGNDCHYTMIAFQELTKYFQ